MSKPKKPSKKIWVPGGRTFYFEHSSNKVSLLYFLDWVMETLPKGAKDVTLSLDEEWTDDEPFGAFGGCNLYLAWKERKDNTHYKSEMKKYQKRIKKWKEEYGNS